MKWKLVKVPEILSYEEFKDIVITLECVTACNVDPDWKKPRLRWT